MKKTVNLHLAQIWKTLFDEALVLLAEGISPNTDGKKIQITHAVRLIGKKDEVIGFSHKTFSMGGFLARICIEGEFSKKTVTIEIGANGPEKLGLFVFPGYTKEASVRFFDDQTLVYPKPGGGTVGEYFTSLTEFPSEAFCKECAEWIFQGVHPGSSIKEKIIINNDPRC